MAQPYGVTMETQGNRTGSTTVNIVLPESLTLEQVYTLLERLARENLPVPSLVLHVKKPSGSEELLYVTIPYQKRSTAYYGYERKPSCDMDDGYFGVRPDTDDD